jgi:hypothetical protein
MILAKGLTASVGAGILLDASGCSDAELADWGRGIRTDSI